MIRSLRTRRATALGLLTILASLLSCGRDLTGPNARLSATIAFAPRFVTAQPIDATADNVASLVPFERVRIILRKDGEEAKSTVVSFPAGADSVALSINVAISQNTGSEGEPFDALLRFINAAGDTVFAGGPIVVLARPSSSGGGQAVEMPVNHVGPGSQAVTVTVAPDSITANTGATISLTATARDGQGQPVANAVIGFISRNPALVAIPNLGVGTGQLVGIRGSTWVIAQLINGALDSTHVTILPVPTAITKVSGDAQSALVSTAFTNPLRVRLTAADAQPVANWPVTFAVTAGAGSLSATTVSTDATGAAEVTWTAGATVGAGSVTASIPAPALSTVFTGTQASALPTSLVFFVQPGNITAGNPIPPVVVHVLNGLGEVISGFNGSVGLELIGGTAGSALIGTDTVNAVNGIATFSGLTVNKAGTTYRLVAGVSGAPTVQSNQFTVLPAPAATVTVVGGTGQSAPPSTALTDSIKVRVQDQFGFDVVGATVNFAVTAGGGSVSPTSAVTDATGRAATRWTIGASGTQTVSASVGALTPVTVNASVIGGGGGPAVLFAGFDVTTIAVGRTKSIPIHLSAPSATPTWVHLTDLVETAYWEADSVEIPAGQVRVDVGLVAEDLGAGFVYLNSAAGNDSIFVEVTSAWVVVGYPDWGYFIPGDTVRGLIRLSDPAPAGGVAVLVESSDPTLVTVAAGTGRGALIPTCVAYYCVPFARGDTLQPYTGEMGRVIGTPGPSVTITVPEGELYAQLIWIVADSLPGTSASITLTPTALNHASGAETFFLQELFLQIYSDAADLFDPIGVGQVERAYVYEGYGEGSRERRVRITNRHPGIVQVDTSAIIRQFASSSEIIQIRGLAPGFATVVFELIGAPVDSLTFEVVAPRLTLDPMQTGAVGAQTVGAVRLRGAGGAYTRPSATDVPFTLRANPAGIVAFDQVGGTLAAGDEFVTFTLRYIAAGSAWVVAESPGFLPESTFVLTNAPQFQLYAATPNVATGLLNELYLAVPSTAFIPATQVSVTSLNPELFRVVTPTVTLSAGTPNPQFILEGIAAGQGFVRLSAPGYTDATFAVDVAQALLSIGALPDSQRVDPDVPIAVQAFTSASFTPQPAADTVFAILRSSRPSVVEVVDSIITVPFGSAFSTTNGGAIRYLAADTATLSIHALGFPVDTETVRGHNPRLVATASPSLNIGPNTGTRITLFRESGIAAPLAVSVTHSGPGVATLSPASISFAAGAPSTTIDVTHGGVGIDTLTFSAAGTVSARQLINLGSTSRVQIPNLLSSYDGGAVEEFGARLRSGESPTALLAPTTKRFVLSVSDTTKARVLQDTITIQAWTATPSQVALVRFLDPGFVDLILRDVDGVIAPDTVDVEVNPRQLTGSTSYTDREFVLGVGQRTYPYEVYVERQVYAPESLWVRLEVSKPGIISLPDSVLIPAGWYDAEIPIAALDSVGSVRVRASAPGWNPFEFDVYVTRTALGVFTAPAFVGFRSLIELYAYDALTYQTRYLTSDVPVRWVPSRPGLVDTTGTSVTLGETAYFAEVLGPLALTTGSLDIFAEDARPASFGSFIRTGDRLDIGVARIVVPDGRLYVTPGLQSRNVRTAANVSPAGGDATFTLTSLGSKFTSPDSPLFKDFNAFSSASIAFALNGLSLGTDTLVISAPGYLSDTTEIVVDQGVLRRGATFTNTIVNGDSVLVTLEFLDAQGYSAESVAPQTITFSPDTTLVVSNGLTAVSSIVVPAGSTSFSFWVKRVQNGDSSLTASGTFFRPLIIPFSTRVIP